MTVRSLSWLVAAEVVIASFSIFPVSAKPAEPPDYGTQPNWEEFRSTGERELLGRLVDPSSAQISWPYLATQGSLKAFMGRTAFGYWSCGLVNAKNRMGGYTGATFFLIMQKNGLVTSLDIGQSDGLDTATITCTNALKKGLLPAVPATPSAPVVAPNPTPRFGFRFMMVPQGAYVAALDTGSEADVSGLKIGSVITSINGISLAEMDQATVLKIFDALQTAKLTLIGQSDIQLSRK